MAVTATMKDQVVRALLMVATLRRLGSADARREAHQVLIVRINDGVTEPFTALLDLPPEQRAQAATALALWRSTPGQVDTVFLRLTRAATAPPTSSPRAPPASTHPTTAIRTTCTAYTPNSPSP
jgi:hypothetical protein